MSRLDKIENGNEVSETELLTVFGLQEKQLKNILQPIAKVLMLFSYYLKTGNLLSENETPHIFEICFQGMIGQL